MSDSPLDLDLKILPDWLKEPADKNPYADFAGEAPERSSRREFGGGGRGGRPGQGGGGQNRGAQSRGPGAPRSGGPQNRGPQGRQGQGSREGQGPNRPPRQGGPNTGVITIPKRDNRDTPRHPEPAAEAAIPLHVEFVPETHGIEALAKQIKSSHRAYPLYGLGRMFLNKPERHRVRITSNAPACPLFQVGEDGPISLSRNTAEREAFRVLKSTYYVEETVQLDPPKGNYVNVARCRLSGVLLGPTNHHGYQPALRRLYEARFSRRMDFNEFLRQIEVVSDPAVVEQWKTEASSITVFRTTQETEPLEFKSPKEVEDHFRKTYLPTAVRSAKTVEVSGIASRDVNERQIRNAIRTGWEKERGFPAQIVNHIRPHFLEAGLHIWKHRKRILFISTVRPIRFGSDAKDISENIVNILKVIDSAPRCTRADISTQLLKPHESEAEYPKLKAVLASDLHWLIQSGHVIEFHDGILDLPLLPKELAREPDGSQGESAEGKPTPIESRQSEPVSQPEEAPEAQVENSADQAEPIAEPTQATSEEGEGRVIIDSGPAEEMPVNSIAESPEPPTAPVDPDKPQE